MGAQQGKDLEGGRPVGQPGTRELEHPLSIFHGTRLRTPALSQSMRISLRTRENLACSSLNAPSQGLREQRYDPWLGFRLKNHLN